ncbi:glycosyl transferase, family 2 [Methanosarcina sp. MTP4]|uniref:glycosyltransferase n=1 Tax=Methanosarcina sp. MTP4 TaxID=1434100 RepID=UPI0006158B6C|nr:glycosyltransferase [Methanosarcina sp. MTP4]AKB24197.1 glycosyl transferase, family 2 [Methanosarcina sp. MTP4]
MNDITFEGGFKETSELLNCISVIIPVYNDFSGLKDTLKSLIAQKYPSNQFEIIVADNGSSDSTCDVAREFMEKCPETVKLVVENTIQSSYAARNKGIQIAKGSLIAFVDADMTVERDWLSRINASMHKNLADYLGCNVEIYSESESICALYNKMAGFPVEEYVDKRHFAPTCCLVVRRNVFDEVGFFDPKLISSGDYEFGNRVYSSGRKLYYDPSIIMKHPARTSFRQLIKKSFRVGRGFYQLSKFYPELHRNMYRNANPMNKSGSSWKLFTFGKGNDIWDSASIPMKIAFVLIDLANKAVKPVGHFYEKYKGTN